MSGARWIMPPRRRLQPTRWSRVALLARALPVVMIGVACHRGAAPSNAPLLQQLTPERADVSRGAVVDVLVQGQGFDSLNVVQFGTVTLTQVRRVSPITLRFSVPLDDEQRVGRGEAPPIALAPGVYPVRVVTARGTSNALSFTLQRAGSAR
jgi:hypothetical protein